MMKKFFIPALALAAASVAVPAMAQSYGPQHRDDRGGRYEQDRGGRYDNDRGGRYDNNHHDRGDRYDHDNGRNWQPIAQRRNQLERLIDRGMRAGWLSRREAGYVRSEMNDLVRLEYRYQRNGMSWRERQDLQNRYDRLIEMTRDHRQDHRRQDRRR